MTAASRGATGTEPWTLTVYVADEPRQRHFPTEEKARAEAHRLEMSGWEEGIPDTLAAPDGHIVWHRAHDAAG
jgi:hypothetical protein